MTTSTAAGAGTRDDPWKLTTPSGQSEYLAFRDETLDPPALVVVVGKTELRYQLRAIDDLHGMLKAHGDCAARQRRRAETCYPRHGRSVGALVTTRSAAGMG